MQSKLYISELPIHLINVLHFLQLVENTRYIVFVINSLTHYVLHEYCKMNL